MPIIRVAHKIDSSFKLVISEMSTETPLDLYIVNVNVPYFEFQKLVNELSRIFVIGKPNNMGFLSEQIVKQLDLFISASRILRKQFGKYTITELIRNRRDKYLRFFLEQNNEILNTLHKLRLIIEAFDPTYHNQTSMGKTILDKYIDIFQNLKETTDKWFEKIPVSI